QVRQVIRADRDEFVFDSAEPENLNTRTPEHPFPEVGPKLCVPVFRRVCLSRSAGGMFPARTQTEGESLPFQGRCFRIGEGRPNRYPPEGGKRTWNPAA